MALGVEAGGLSGSQAMASPTPGAPCTLGGGGMGKLSKQTLPGSFLALPPIPLGIDS